MENYEILSIAGEGSYGVVMKCKHRSSNRIVAIKKLTDFNNDDYLKKMILREVRILKKLRHENLVQLMEFFKKKKRFYLVFEYLEKTILDDIENNPNGLCEKQTLQYVYQTIRAIEFCHRKNVIHRDIKPENLLVSSAGILKLCDFGCARVISDSKDGKYTEYVATRWYRAPELLVRDKQYGKEVDIWAIGCVFAEMLTGDPLFPGQSDVDQLYMIIKRFGKLCARHQQLLSTYYFNFYQDEDGVEKVDGQENSMNNFHSLRNMFPSWSIGCLHIVALCLHLDPAKRPTAYELLNDNYFRARNVDELWFTSLLQRSADFDSRSVASCSHNKNNRLTSHTVTDIEVYSKENSELTVVGKYPATNCTSAKRDLSNQKRKSPRLLTPMTSDKTTPFTETHRQVSKICNVSPKKEFIHDTNEHLAKNYPRASLFSHNQSQSAKMNNTHYIPVNKHEIINKCYKSEKHRLKNENLTKTMTPNTLESKYHFMSDHDVNLPYLEITGRKSGSEYGAYRKQYWMMTVPSLLSLKEESI